MDDISLLESVWPIVLFCLMVYAVAFIVRRVADAIIRKWSWNKSYWWLEVVLPIMPLFVGGCLGWCLKAFPYPAGITHWTVRAGFGAACGLGSGTVYRVVKSLIKKHWPDAVGDSDVPSVP